MTPFVGLARRFFKLAEDAKAMAARPNPITTMELPAYRAYHEGRHVAYYAAACAMRAQDRQLLQGDGAAEAAQRQAMYDACGGREV